MITSWSGQAAPLHSETVISRLQHKGLQTVGELLYAGELFLPALQFEHKALLCNSELLVYWTFAILPSQLANILQQDTCKITYTP